MLSQLLCKHSRPSQYFKQTTEILITADYVRHGKDGNILWAFSVFSDDNDQRGEIAIDLVSGFGAVLGYKGGNEA